MKFRCQIRKKKLTGPNREDKKKMVSNKEFSHLSILALHGYFEICAHDTPLLLGESPSCEAHEFSSLFLEGKRAGFNRRLGLPKNCH
jgi:hypothetical protein